MTKPASHERIYETGDHWLTQKSGRSNYYGAHYDSVSRQVVVQSLGTADVDEAKRLLDRLAVSQRRYDRADPSEVPFRHVLQRYFREHAKHTASHQTAEKSLKRWNAFFRDAFLADVSQSRQREFVEWLKTSEGLSNSTIKRTFVAAQAAVNYSLRDDEIAHAPKFLTGLPDGEPRQRILTADETRSLFGAVNELHINVFLMLMFNTLSRPGAVLGLTRQQCDVDRSVINLNPAGRTQTKKYRPIVRMTETIRPIIVSATGEHIINYRGRPIGSSIKSAWQALRRRARLDDDVVPYTIRHTMASECNARGVPPHEIAAFLGHKRPGITDRYIHLQPSYLANVANAIDDYFAELNL